MSDESKQAKHNKRRRQILGATLRLLRRHGADITTAQIAEEAHCSKETLYNWFGDRDGIMLALVAEQARGMNEVLNSGFQNAEGNLEARLKAHCTLLLDILTGEAVLVVNRVAMAQACADHSSLGTAVLADWNEQVAKPFINLFQEGNEAGEFAIHSADEALENLIGLLVGDRQRRLLLGEIGARPNAEAMAAIAAKAVQRWMMLYGR
ncbi:MAG: TetR/AcrR family transcriptional regulator [Rhizobiaceae bacterium]